MCFSPIEESGKTHFQRKKHRDGICTEFLGLGGEFCARVTPDFRYSVLLSLG